MLDVCSQNSSGRKAAKFGGFTYVHWDYSPTNLFVPRSLILHEIIQNPEHEWVF